MALELCRAGCLCVLVGIKPLERGLDSIAETARRCSCRCKKRQVASQSQPRGVPRTGVNIGYPKGEGGFLDLKWHFDEEKWAYQRKWVWPLVLASVAHTAESFQSCQCEMKPGVSEVER